jgi:hypothetical protein
MSNLTVAREVEAHLLEKTVWTRRRTEPRYQCGPATAGRLDAPAEGKPVRAWLLNLSTRGAGLLLEHPLGPAVNLVIHLKTGDQDRQYRLPARVIHVTNLVNGDWLVGCEFESPLSQDDLETLL